MIDRPFRIIAFLLIALISHLAAFGVKPTIFSSPSTVSRELEMEKANKEKIKQFKKTYKDVKDVAIEKWSDGKTYYVLYSKEDGGMMLMPVDADKPYRSSSSDISFATQMELVKHAGHYFFKAGENYWIFYDGSNTFNPATAFKQLGNTEYVIYGSDTKYVYKLDGTPLLSADSYEFRPATRADFSEDEGTGMSVYHPDLPNRFFGTTKIRHDGSTSYDLGYFKSPNSSFIAKVPGGEYYIGGNTSFMLPTSISTEAREDLNGNIFTYKVFNAEYENRFGNYLSICIHSGTNGRPILPVKANKIKVSTPDQVVYYSYFDSESLLNRMGCVSLVDSTFTVPARFNDVKVFYDSVGKPYALVRLSGLAPYEVYDPSKSYDYRDMTELQMLFELGRWSEFIGKALTPKLEDLPFENLYPVLHSQIEQEKHYIDMSNQTIVRLKTNTLFDSERKDIDLGKSIALDSFYFTDLPFGTGYTLDEAIEYHAGKMEASTADKLRTMSAYIKTLADQCRDAKRRIDSATAEYKENIRRAAYQEALANLDRRHDILEAEQARQANSAIQQAAIFHLLSSVFNISDRNGVNVISYANPFVNAQSTHPVNAQYAPPATDNDSQPTSDLDRFANPYANTHFVTPDLKIEPSASGVYPLPGSYVVPPATPAASSSPAATATTSSSSSSGNMCRACFGSGKCPHCHGNGRYMPNLDGKYIDCTSCRKTGSCHQCNGQGHH